MRRRSEAGARRDEDIPQREFIVDVPSDVVNEQIVLAAMMVDEGTCDELLKVLPADAFYAKEHRVIREALAELRRRSLPFDPATVSRLQPDADIRILERYPSQRPELPQNIGFHVDALLWDAQRARITRGPLATLIEGIQDPHEEKAKLRAVARQLYESLDADYGRARFLRDPTEVVREMMQRLDKRAGGEAVYPFGIDGLDFYENGKLRLITGSAPGAMTLITALSGSGKSTTMAHLALSLARKRRRVLFGAWEEVAPVTLELLTTLSLGWSRTRILQGKSNTLRTEGGDDYEPLTPGERVIFEERAHQITKWVTFFDNPFQLSKARDRTARASNDEHLDIIHDHIESSGADVFFADLLHRCFVEDTPRDEKLFLNRMLAITEATKVHTIAAHQQRAKDIEQRADKRPTREGIIGAGAWLDMFWTVVAPHIPAKWKNVPDDTIEFHVLKQRNGPWPLGVAMDWDPDTGQITGGRSFDVKSVEKPDEAWGQRQASGPQKRKRSPFPNKR